MLYFIMYLISKDTYLGAVKLSVEKIKKGTYGKRSFLLIYSALRKSLKLIKMFYDESFASFKCADCTYNSSTFITVKAFGGTCHILYIFL